MNKRLLIGCFAILLFAGVAVAIVSNLHAANGTFTGSIANGNATYVDIAPPPANLGSDGDFYYQLNQPITQGGATLYYHMAGVWILIGHIPP